MGCLHILQIAVFDQPQEVGLIFLPEFVGEDFDFDGAGEAGLFHPATDFADVDAALAHHGAVV